MSSKLHQEFCFRKFFPNVSYFDVIFGILKNITDKHIEQEWILSDREDRIFLQFLCDSGLLALNFKQDGSDSAYFKITSKGLKFIKDYQRVRSLVI